MQLTPTQGRQSREDQLITGSPPFDSSFSAVPAAPLLLWSGAAGHPTTGPPCSHPTRSTYLHSHIQVFISAAPGVRLQPCPPCLGLAPQGAGPCCAEEGGSPTARDPQAPLLLPQEGQTGRFPIASQCLAFRQVPSTGLPRGPEESRAAPDEAS